MKSRATRLIGELRRAGMARWPRPTFLKEGPELPSGVRIFRSILNCDGLGHGIHARTVSRQFRSQLVPRVLWKRDLPGQLSAAHGPTVNSTGMQILATIPIAAAIAVLEIVT